MPDQQLISIPLRGDQTIRCPRCGSDAALHFDEVSLIDPAGDVFPLHEDGGEGLSVVSATICHQETPGQRHMIVLPHWCADCGERGEIVLQHEAGGTVGRYRGVPAGPAEAAPKPS